MDTVFESKKLYAVIIAFIFVATSLITFSVIHRHYDVELKNRITENRLTANLLSRLIYEHQMAAIGILESHASHPSFVEAVQKKDFNQTLSHLKSLTKRHSEIDVLFITDQYGTLWADYPVDKTAYGTNLAFRDWYKGVSKNWRPYISPIYRRIVLEKGLAVAISVPVFDRKGTVIGILSSGQRTSFLATFINESIVDPKKNITLLDQEGNIIFSNALPYGETITKYPDVRVQEKAVTGVSIDMEIADARNKKKVSYVSIAPIKRIGWSVIVGLEKDTILQSLYGHFIRFAVMGFIIFLFLTVSVLYFRREYKYHKTKELQASEKKYRTLFNESMDGICLADAETGLIVDCNEALAALVCRERTELIGQPQAILHPPQDIQEGFSTTFRQHLLNKHGQVLETQVITRTGDTRDVEIKANVVVLGGRKLLQGVFHDISEHKKAEEAKRKLNEELEQLVRERTMQLEATNKELEAFAYSISHDLRAPIRSIEGFSQILLEDYQDKLDDTAKSYLDRVRKATQHMENLIEGLQKLSLVTRSELLYRSVDLSTMVRKIFEKLQQDNPDRTVDVIIQEGIFASGDSSLLQDALENLVHNAWKFTSREARPRIEFGTIVKEGKTVCFIKDNGVGFDMVYANKLFGAFQRLHSSREFPGTGIGLATVQRIINRHGGRIWAEAEVEKGATFYFTLPGLEVSRQS